MADERTKYRGSDIQYTVSFYSDTAKTTPKLLSSFQNIYAWVYSSIRVINKFSLIAADGHTLMTQVDTSTVKFVVDGAITKTMKTGVVKLELRVEEEDLDQADGLSEDSSVLDTYILVDAENKTLA